jgi:GntR family transcriptional regulator
MAGYEVPTPKYLRVLNTVRERIENGTYPPGAALPSESQLCNEFNVSRPTVLKALGILKQDGWIESQQGKGSFVRGRPPAGRGAPAYAKDAVELDETARVELLHVGPVLASPRIAAALQIPDGTPVYERRRRTVADAGPVDLVATFVPVEIAVGTAITKPEPIAGSVVEHLARLKQVRPDYVTEALTARTVTAEEAELLGVPADEAAIVVTVTVHQASGEPLLTSLIVMPGSRHEIEDVYPLS